MTDKVPAELAVYQVDQWRSAGGVRAYVDALQAAGVCLRIAAALRSDAEVAEMREARRCRMAYDA